MKKCFFRTGTFIICLFLVAFVSCTDLSGVENDLKDLTNRVNSLEDAVTLLKRAYNDGKIISSVTPTSSNNGYVLKFIDNQTITIANGANESSIIKSIDKNEEDGIITLVMADGTIFKFNLDVTFPTSIETITKQIYLPTKGIYTLSLIVNPSNAYINTDVEGGKCSFVLNLISKSRASYVNESTSYKIQKVEKVNESEGVYDVIVEDSGLRSNYEEKITVVARTKNSNGEDINISSNIVDVEWCNGEDFYSFKIGDAHGSFTNKNITVQLPKGSAIKNLCPTFKTNGTVYVNGIEQVSGVSVQNFSSPVDYKVVAADGSQKIYTVFVQFV